MECLAELLEELPRVRCVVRNDNSYCVCAACKFVGFQTWRCGVAIGGRWHYSVDTSDRLRRLKEVGVVVRARQPRNALARVDEKGRDEHPNVCASRFVGRSPRLTRFCRSRGTKGAGAIVRGERI